MLSSEKSLSDWLAYCEALHPTAIDMGLARVQAVDVVKPFYARVLGLAELRLEVVGGGGGDAEAPLAFLHCSLEDFGGIGSDGHRNKLSKLW